MDGSAITQLRGSLNRLKQERDELTSMIATMEQELNAYMSQHQLLADQSKNLEIVVDLGSIDIVPNMIEWIAEGSKKVIVQDQSIPHPQASSSKPSSQQGQLKNLYDENDNEEAEEILFQLPSRQSNKRKSSIGKTPVCVIRQSEQDIDLYLVYNSDQKSSWLPSAQIPIELLEKYKALEEDSDLEDIGVVIARIPRSRPVYQYRLKKKNQVILNSDDDDNADIAIQTNHQTKFKIKVVDPRNLTAETKRKASKIRRISIKNSLRFLSHRDNTSLGQSIQSLMIRFGQKPITVNQAQILAYAKHFKNQLELLSMMCFFYKHSVNLTINDLQHIKFTGIACFNVNTEAQGAIGNSVAFIDGLPLFEKDEGNPIFDEPNQDVRRKMVLLMQLRRRTKDELSLQINQTYEPEGQHSNILSK